MEEFLSLIMLIASGLWCYKYLKYFWQYYHNQMLKVKLLFLFLFIIGGLLGYFIFSLLIFLFVWLFYADAPVGFVAEALIVFSLLPIAGSYELIFYLLKRRDKNKSTTPK
ncbi:hypothetical protein J4210_00885 [Candidatus Woesearchaeota archaeon]|nr:hypothetical protein [Candidatus Woesearchaeota archaeon]